MRLLILQRKTEIIDGRKREVIPHKEFFVTDTNKMFSTNYGNVAPEDLQKPSGSVVESHTGKSFVILDADYSDCYKRMKRLPQAIPLKDIGLIIAETGIGPESIVVEGGTGSGALACSLARIAKQVTSYEIREEHQRVAQQNAAMLGLKNITFKLSGLYDGMGETNVDVVVIDVPEPWRVCEHAQKTLRVGGWFVSYSPNLTQVQQLMDKLPFAHVKTVELVERPWIVDDKRIKPDKQEIAHSGFLVFARKLTV